MSSTLDYVELPADGKPTGCVITLHGRGVNGEDLMPLATMLNLPTVRFLFPHAPLDAEGFYGGRAWYPSSVDPRNGILQSRGLLLDLLQKIEAEEMPAERIVLMGFSQGGVMSLDAGLRYPRRLGGIIALSGFLYDPNHLFDSQEGFTNLPILIAHGTEDAVLPVDGSRQAADLLKQKGLKVTFKEYPIGHEIYPEEIEDIRVFLLQCLPEG